MRKGLTRGKAVKHVPLTTEPTRTHPRIFKLDQITEKTLIKTHHDQRQVAKLV